MSFPEHLIIGGEKVKPASGATFSSINPADESMICEVPEAGEAEVNQAIDSARQAFDDGRWSDLPPARRARVLRKLAGLVRQHNAELARLETLEHAASMQPSAPRLAALVGRRTWWLR